MEKSSSNKAIVYLSQPDKVSMADEWFELATSDHFWMKWRFQVLQSRLNKVLGTSRSKYEYLEIGCGHGEFIKQMESQNDIVLDGCDLNLFALEKINNVKGNIYVYDILSQQPIMLNKYHTVFLLDVIEHIDNDVQFLEAALAHVKEGGLIVINVPALSILFSKYDLLAGHKRRYSVKEIKRLFEQVGVTPIDIRYWGFLLLPIAIIRKFYLLMIPHEKVIKTGFAPPIKLINLFLQSLMKIEFFITNLSLPGTSIVAIGRKLKK